MIMLLQNYENVVLQNFGTIQYHIFGILLWLCKHHHTVAVGYILLYEEIKKKLANK